MKGMKRISSILSTVISSLVFSIWATISLAQLADTPWPKFRHDAHNTGRSPYLGAQTGKLKWKFTADASAPFVSSPAIGSDGTIYVGSWDGYLYAINPNGRKKWSSGFWATQSSPAIGSDGTIYVGSFYGYLYAIKPDGWPKWSFLTGDEIHSAPAIGSDGTIYVGSGDRYLYAINPDGTEKWNFLADRYIYSSPAIGSDGTIYVGSVSENSTYGYLYAINPDGSLKWKFLTDEDILTYPAIGSDGTIYVGSGDHNLYAINPDGSLKWKFLTGGMVSSSPAIGSDGTIYVGSGDRYLYAINPDGSLKWKFGARDSIVSSPAIGSDGTIYVGSGDYYLYAINPDGTEKWKFLTDAAIYSSPAIGSDGTIYVGSSIIDYWPVPTFYGHFYAIGEGGGCSLESITKDQSKLDLYRKFRDKTLSQTKKGKEYMRLYYKHSPEVVSLLLKNAKLRSQARRLSDMAIPEIRLILDAKRNDLSPVLKTSILSFLKNVSQKASSGLKADIERSMADIEEGKTREILGG